jgi:hypothetical protein
VLLFGFTVQVHSGLVLIGLLNCENPVDSEKEVSSNGSAKLHGFALPVVRYTCLEFNTANRFVISFHVLFLRNFVHPTP